MFKNVKNLLNISFILLKKIKIWIHVQSQVGDELVLGACFIISKHFFFWSTKLADLIYKSNIAFKESNFSRLTFLLLIIINHIRKKNIVNFSCADLQRLHACVDSSQPQIKWSITIIFFLILSFILFINREAS